MAVDTHATADQRALAHSESSVISRRILVLDDHEMVQAGLRALLGRQDWVARCLGASTCEQAYVLARRYAPHVALVDLFVGDESGLQACRGLFEAQPLLRVVLMSGSGQVSPALAKAAGACGFIPKHWPSAAIIEGVRRASAGLSVFSRADRIIPGQRLSKRETDVLQHLARGLSNPEVAVALHLSRHTVKQHTCTVYRKLGVRNRTEAASRAQQLGLVM